MPLARCLLAAALASSSLLAQAAQPALTRITAASGLPRAPEQEAVTFERAELSFKVDPARKWLEGDATLTFRADTPVDRLVVDLDRNYAIDAVEVDGKTVAAAQWRNPEGRMTIDLPASLAAGTRATLRIRYSGAPHVANKAPWDGGFVWATAPTGEPWVATAVQGEGCDLFWPCIDHPLGEPREVVQHITVPSPLVVAGNGIAEGMEEKNGWRTYHWRAKNPNTYAVSLNIGPYELLQGEYKSRYGNTIPLRFWHLKGNAAKAEGLFAEFTPMLDFFEEMIGPYPFADEKMGVVETPHLGMEHQTINAYGNDYRKGDAGYDWLLQHELAHEWFGNQLTHRDWDDFWLHEGCGSYMQPLYLQWLRGDMEYMTALMKQRAALVNKYPVISGRGLPENEVYKAGEGPGNDTYYKGSLMLHTLRGQIGDDAFFRAIRELVYGTATPKPGNFKSRHASTNDFIAIVNRITGKDYRWFFDGYLRSAALPELRATRDAGGLWLRWKTKDDTPFPLPVQVRVGDKVIDVPMTDGRGRVELPAAATYTLDPHSRVLRELPHIAEFQKDTADRAKAAAEKAKAEAARKP
ncbi:M1 family metallopeptidase [Thermomonas carbonis]|uniref:Aminopeptidase N n=1 Tax=Thermomonas carbonis TaxID=1463158 RepID=A0A7G9SPF3_9GAMM|nr:M1 family metallopeptidase [Thermomonas carbonis]QNN69728.1 M1 family metallopeptidase [Thermomonas carbonis]GHB95121.1 peptidase M1 [Thermomonas carbonis]